MDKENQEKIKLGIFSPTNEDISSSRERVDKAVKIFKEITSLTEINFEEAVKKINRQKTTTG